MANTLSLALKGFFVNSVGVDYNKTHMQDILNGLNHKQREAVEAIEGPVLVVAGPGSGKTKTLTHRIAYLIYKGVKPYNILAITFTNKAAEEIKHRVLSLLTSSFPSYQQPTMGTFHSICARILQRDGVVLGFSPGFTIYDEEDALKLIKIVLLELHIDQKQYNPARIRAIISSLKNNLQTPEDYEIEAEGPFYEKVHSVYRAYQAKLKLQNVMDFDDLLMKTVELFRDHPKILEKYQAWFRYILVDEFQDTNIGQYKIASYLAQGHKNLYCIGDMDQSIYSFRGADYRNVLNFEKDWPDAQVITLEQNYRSTQNILDTAHRIISVNAGRKEKNLWTQNGRGDLLTIKEVGDEQEEGEFIVSEIERLVSKRNLKLNDFVALYRTNAQSRAIEEAFLRVGFPYKIIGGIKFFQRKEVKDLLAWVRLCLNPNDAMAMSRVSEIPAKFLCVPSETSAGILPPSVVAGLPLNRGRKYIKIDCLVRNFAEKSEELKLTNLLSYIIKQTGFEKWLRDGTERGEERWENVLELLSVCSKYDANEPRTAIRTLTEEAALAQEADNVEYEKDLVNLMTLHAAKGLEFPVVFIAGFEQGLLPHSRALFGVNLEEMEEERRLCYVGVTRAKQKLYLTFTQRRMLFGKTQYNPPSEFLQNIPEHLIEFIPAEEERIVELD